MDPSYVNVVETRDMVWTLVAYLIHGGIVFAHVSLACFLVATGLHDIVRPTRPSRWLRRLGAVGGALPRPRQSGLFRITAGLLLFAPLAFGTPMGVSLSASVVVFIFLVWVERALATAERPLGRLVRTLSIAFAAVTALFIVWEGEDNLALTADVLGPAMEWRSEEVDWQADTDPKAPKIGELAPDFELQDPDGVTRVRLSEFRGKRPVALVFGSYT